MPGDGESFNDLSPPPLVAAQRAQAAAEGGGWRLPPPAAQRLVADRDVAGSTGKAPTIP